ncbi:outer membrane protein, multidrug efflux system [Trichlorobacter thiogenes]|uniref:Outer membrane protein, multidrug efflux system n=1 Tax=Trichlorobacter thiogenes TaxID=115783 RepID=A0A1T4KDC7_9BACT|nr:efflux transporter outer membrane subunit [Trichlorobacter thiogenes]SJZ40432.1 outer membrane protein, multidrug efflux system [Trichlorobacter thiogenes]
MIRSIVTAHIVLICLAGCSMKPDYVRPEAPISVAWPTGPAYKSNSPQTEDLTVAYKLKWNEFYVHPQLQKLIALALANNRDLRVASLNVEKSRAQYRIRRADLVPTIAASGSGTVQRLPADVSPSGQAMIARNYNLSLGLSSYEIDLFGRVQSLKDQVLEQYLATEQARHSVQISLIAEVANNYLTLAADKERLKLARETLASQQASYQLIQSRFMAGASSELDLHQAQTSVDAARVDVARYTSLVAQDENLLTLVVGTQLAAELLPTGFSSVGTLRELPPGVPSEVLQRRPDVMQAELLLKAANANIGAARAAFFPRITLNTSIGTSSDQLTGLFSPGSLAWGFAPQFTLPIFDYGRNMAGLTVAERDRDIYLAQYDKTIQSAFREVADALAQNGTVSEQLQAQQSLTETTAKSYRLSQARYQGGAASYLNVLDSQRSLYRAQQGLISVNLTRLTNQVTLYKVLGGGSEQ